MITMLVVLVLTLPLLVALFGFWWFIGQTTADNAVKRQLKLTRYQPDHLGNYPAYFNPKTGTFFVPSPGNRAYPEQFLPVSANFKQVHEANRPLTINYGGAKVAQLEEPGEPIEEPGEPGSARAVQEVEPEKLPQLEGARTITDIQALLAQDKTEGRFMEDSIRERTGLKAKSGKSFRGWVDYWNSLEGGQDAG